MIIIIVVGLGKLPESSPLINIACPIYYCHYKEYSLSREGRKFCQPQHDSK
jgi:hypothetical protein